MRSTLFATLCVAASAGALVIGCGSTLSTAQDTQPDRQRPQDEVREHVNMFEGVDRAVCVMRPTRGNQAHGVVHFREHDGKVTVTAHFRGLEPNSTHGFHIHEYGDITKGDGTSAGGHYNPGGVPHGLPPHSPRHAGDLGNVTADENGEVRHTVTVENITIAGLENPIIGRGMILHSQRDDGGQPTGNAGARIAMGVIGVANPQTE